MSQGIDQFLTWLYGIGNVSVLFNLLIKGSVILLFVYGAHRLLRHHHASVRYGVWAIGLAILFFLPSLQSILPQQYLKALPKPLNDDFLIYRLDERAWMLDAAENNPVLVKYFDEHPPVPHDIETTTMMAERTVAIEKERIQREDGGVKALISYWPLYITLIWFIGAVYFIGRFGFSMLSLHRIARKGVPVKDKDWLETLHGCVTEWKIKKHICLIMDERIPVPAIYGYFKPVLFIPSEALTWSADERRMVVLHELAHLKRRDFLINVFAHILCALWWPNPLVWKATKQIRMEQEKASDDRLLQSTFDEIQYADFLLNMTKLLTGQKPAGRLVLGMASPAEMKERFSHILKSREQRKTSPFMKSILGFGLMLLLIPTSWVSLRSMHVHHSKYIREPDKVEQCLDGLKNPDVKIRVRAAWRLGDLEERSTVPHLVEALKDNDPRVRGMAAWALGEIKGLEILQPLLEAANDKDPYAREMIIKAIGELESSDALACLKSAMHDENPDVRYAVVWALGELRHEEAFRSITDALKDDCVSVRAYAVEIMARLGTDEAVEVLLPLLEDPELRIRERTAYALGRSSKEEAAKALISYLNAPEVSMRIEVIRALGWIRHPCALEPVLEMLHDTDMEVRAMAVWALDNITLRQKNDS